MSTVKDIHVKTNKYDFYTSEAANYRTLTNKIQTSIGSTKKMYAIKRMRFLNTLKSKTEHCIKYINYYSSLNKKTIIFTDNKEQAHLVSDYVYHSNTDDKFLNLFQEDKINHLVLVNKGSVGVTYNNLDNCIISAINSSNDFIQQRIFRTILFKENKIANIHILISKDTIQEEWIEKSLSNLHNKNITYV